MTIKNNNTYRNNVISKSAFFKDDTLANNL